MARRRSPLDRVARAAGALDRFVAPGIETPRRVVSAALGRRSLEAAVAGKVVVITGASSGIGKEVALRVGEAGGTVAIVARREPELSDVAARIIEGGGTASIHVADLSVPEDAQRVADEILAAHGRVDVLVNNAGRSIRRRVSDSTHRAHDFERTMAINYFGALRLILAFLPGMRERGTGQIVNVSTMGLNLNTPRFAAYLASKAALDAFSRSLAAEVVSDGVQVSDVYMPLARTPMIAPTKVYRGMPALSPRQAADLVCDAIIDRPRQLNPGVGRITRALYQLSPGTADRVVNTIAVPDRNGSPEPDDD